MEEHWKWASLLGAQASGSRVWTASHQLSSSRFHLDVNCFLPGPLPRPAHSLALPAHSPAPMLLVF